MIKMILSSAPNHKWLKMHLTNEQIINKKISFNMIWQYSFKVCVCKFYKKNIQPN